MLRHAGLVSGLALALAAAFNPEVAQLVLVVGAVALAAVAILSCSLAARGHLAPRTGLAPARATRLALEPAPARAGSPVKLVLLAQPRR